MANQLEVAMQKSIIALYERGWSRRRIARELGLDRGTVRSYITVWEASRAAGAKPAISTAGSEGQNPPPGAISTAGFCAGNGTAEAKPATADPSGVGRRSLCTSHRAFIEARAAQGLSAQRIWQDLVGACAFQGSYESVKRFDGQRGQSL